MPSVMKITDAIDNVTTVIDVLEYLIATRPNENGLASILDHCADLLKDGKKHLLS